MEGGEPRPKASDPPGLPMGLAGPASPSRPLLVPDPLASPVGTSEERELATRLPSSTEAVEGMETPSASPTTLRGVPGVGPGSAFVGIRGAELLGANRTCMASWILLHVKTRGALAACCFQAELLGQGFRVSGTDKFIMSQHPHLNGTR